MSSPDYDSPLFARRTQSDAQDDAYDVESDFRRRAPDRGNGLANPLADRFNVGSALNNEAMGVNHFQQLEDQARLKNQAAGADGMYDRASAGNRRSFDVDDGGYAGDEFADRFGGSSRDSSEAAPDMLDQVFAADPGTRPGAMMGAGQGPGHRRQRSMAAAPWSGMLGSARSSSASAVAPPPKKRRWYQKLWSAIRGKGWK